VAIFGFERVGPHVVLLCVKMKVTNALHPSLVMVESVEARILLRLSEESIYTQLASQSAKAKLN
jgi:hypothetical protein